MFLQEQTLRANVNSLVSISVERRAVCARSLGNLNAQTNGRNDDHEAWPCRCINVRTNKSSYLKYIAIETSPSFTTMVAGTSILIMFFNTKSCLHRRNMRLRGLWRELIKVFQRG